MRHRPHGPFLLTAAIVLLLYCLTGPAYSAGLQETFVEYLELGPATYLKIDDHGISPGDIDKRLMQIYHEHGFQPFWIENGKPGPRASAIRSVLADAASHGMDPRRYGINNIQQFWSSTDASGLVQLDILLTLGMLRYVADQREGRLAPFVANPELFAAARDVQLDWASLKKQALAAPDMLNFLDQQAPPYFQYKALRKKLSEYRQIAINGGWPAIPQGPVLKPGMQDARVPMIRKRLVVAGYPIKANQDTQFYDVLLTAAVKLFQKHHNLAQDGVIGKQTLAAMNVPVSSRITQIALNMERYRWNNRYTHEKGVFVNIAGFEAFAGIAGNMEIEMPVIVGKTYHETPVFSDAIKYVVINPYWTLTPSIARNETLPKLKQDPHYLRKHNMRLFNGWGPDSQELDAASIDWSTVSKKQMNRYRVRQDPGPQNALGTLKLVFPNKHNVYLHDTPAHALFKKDRRAFSHGCIRMDRPAEMAAFVLGGAENGWTEERIKEIVESRKRQVFTLKKPMPVHILYRTTFINPKDGQLYFYEDIYGRDQILAAALFGKRAG